MLSKRERYIAIATGAVVALMGFDYFILEPLLADRADLAKKQAKLAHQVHEDAVTLASSRRATLHWKELRAMGLSTDASATESNLLNALGAWSQDSRLPLLTEHQDRVSVTSGLHDVTFQVTADGPLRDIASFIYRAETARTPARIHELQLAAKNENTDDLQMQIRISTLWEEGHPTGAGQAAAPREGSEQ